VRPRWLSARIGTTLLILDEATDMQAVVLALKAQGLRPVMMPLAEDGKQVIARWHPKVSSCRLASPTGWRCSGSSAGGDSLRPARHQRAAPHRRGASLALPAVAGAGRARRDRRGRASGDRPAVLCRAAGCDRPRHREDRPREEPLDGSREDRGGPVRVRGRRAGRAAAGAGRRGF
jgi:hypothetical protein